MKEQIWRVIVSAKVVLEVTFGEQGGPLSRVTDLDAGGLGKRHSDQSVLERDTESPPAPGLLA